MGGGRIIGAKVKYKSGRRLKKATVQQSHPKIISQFDSLGLDLSHSLLGQAVRHSILCRHPGRGIEVLDGHHRHDWIPDPELDVCSN